MRCREKGCAQRRSAGQRMAEARPQGLVPQPLRSATLLLTGAVSPATPQTLSPYRPIPSLQSLSYFLPCCVTEGKTLSLSGPGLAEPQSLARFSSSRKTQ